jgi:NAD(P)-dependent dehydrogenase (short-subunit alcohol dehydrogenase family)
VPVYDVRGKVALITGGARGIGLATGEALVRRGALVALVDLDDDEVAGAAGRLGRERAVGLVADVTDVAAIERAVTAAVDRFGGIDIVVANAGIAPTPGPVRVIPAAEWERVVEVNLLGVYRTVRAGLEHVIARQGQVVVVSSVYAFANGSMASPYAVAKAGVEQLGRALMLELSVHHASATVAYFGWVDTRMVREAFEERRRMTGREEELLPGFMMKRISPAEAGEALAQGIERRAPRVMAPRWWAAASAMRGLLNPLLDTAGTRSERVQRTLREAEEGAAARAAEDPAGEAPAQDFGAS